MTFVPHDRGSLVDLIDALSVGLRSCHSRVESKQKIGDSFKGRVATSPVFSDRSTQPPRAARAMRAGRIVRGDDYKKA